MRTSRCEAVRRAARLVNDTHQLRILLGVALHDLRDWLEGRGNPPIPVFLKAVDLIDAHGEADDESLT
jgi:hypothetical protein